MHSRTVTIWTCDRPGCGNETQGDSLHPPGWSRLSLIVTDKPHGCSTEIAKRSMDGTAHPVLICAECTKQVTSWWRFYEPKPGVEASAPE